MLSVRSVELQRVKPLKEIRAEILGAWPALRRFLAPFVRDTSSFVEAELKAGRRVLFEGAQGAMLDLDYGTYPFVTSSSTHAGTAAVGAGVGPTWIRSVLGITKAYTTRVGRGPFPTEIEGHVAHYVRETGREYGTTTGRPRRIGWLDLVQLRFANRVNGVTALGMMKLDTLSSIHPLKVCTAYKLRGKTVTEWPYSRRDLYEVEPVYESFPGFSGDLGKARRYADLPLGARQYVEWVEKRLGARIPLVSVGPDREQTIWRDKKSLWG